MPLTFIDIERRKSWKIVFFFLLLMSIYSLTAALVTAPFYPFAFRAATRFWIVVGLTGLLVAGLHLFFSAYNTVSDVTRSLGAAPPDPRDEIHRTFLNIMEELHVITGNKRKIGSVVIPSLSMNALAAADLKGNAVIGVTEGLLSRISRAQLESVVAHESHHILSGDCLETTIAASLFGTLSASIEKIGSVTHGRAFSSPAYLLAWVLLKLSRLLSMFISREREFRADAASVRMTRNPIALAETLHFLSRSWRGAGFIGSGLEMLCIVNTQPKALDESEGFWADLLSTHPPLRKRIDVLLAMARVSITDLNARAAARTVRLSAGNEEPSYYARDPQQQWQGPFSMSELGYLPWLSPLTWLAADSDHATAFRAWKDPAINALFPDRLREEEPSVSKLHCPSCGQSLIVGHYEGTQIFQCRYCSGILTESVVVPRIIARTAKSTLCSKRINALAKAVAAENQLRLAHRGFTGAGHGPIPLISCPKCGHPMLRGFYSQAHLVEIDRCGFCGLTWFERDELAMLQCLIENRIVPEVPSGTSSQRQTEGGLVF